MRCLVTGASGFIGGHVAETLRGKGHEVRTIVRSTSDTRLLEEWGVELFEGDLGDPQTVKRAAGGIDAVVHCAAKVGEWGPIEEYRKVNVEALEVLLEACAAEQIQRFVLLSSLGVYEARDHHGTDESEPLPDRHIDGYTQTKVEAERLAKKYQQDRNIPLVIIRPGFVYGPRDRTVMPRILFNLRCLLVTYFASRKKTLNNVYVGNVIESVLLALEKPEAVGQIYNITDAECVTKQEFFETIARLARLPRPLLTYPMWLGRVLCWIFACLGMLRIPPIVNEARLKFMGLNLDYSIEKARRELGYHPSTTFPEGIRMTIDWLRQEGKIK